jgi:hypothetical protein
MSSEDCWNEVLSALSRAAFKGATPAEKRSFVAALQGNAIAIFLGEEGDRFWHTVDKSDFDGYFEWFDYCKKHKFDKSSREEMKRNIQDRAESSSYIFALILGLCK